MKKILTKIDKQLEEYDAEIGGRLNMFESDVDGRISVKDLKSALEVIRHRSVLHSFSPRCDSRANGWCARPSDEAIEVLLEKLDVDHDSFVPLAEIIALSEGEGLGIVIGEDEPASELVESASNVIADFTAKTLQKSAKEEEKKEKKEVLRKEDVVE